MATTLYRMKPGFQRLLEPLVAVLARRGVSADSVTWFGLALSIVSGAVAIAGLTWRPILLLIPLVLLARMAANAVDGQLARRVGPTTRGGVLNEVCDVAGDAVAYLPFAALVGGVATWLVVAAVVAGLVAEVAAIAGDAARRNHGPLGKSDRALAFALIAIALASGLSATVITVTLATMLVLAALTTTNRMRAL